MVKVNLFLFSFVVCFLGFCVPWRSSASPLGFRIFIKAFCLWIVASCPFGEGD